VTAFIAAPAPRFVLLSVTIFAQRHQIRAVKRDPRVVYILLCQRNPVMNVYSRLDQAPRQAYLAQSAMLIEH
jgi:hypothetical protein